MANGRLRAGCEVEASRLVFGRSAPLCFPHAHAVPPSVFFAHATGTAVGERTCGKTRE
jgi:hypothetical protein